jgi:hypothetical protein
MNKIKLLLLLFAVFTAECYSQSLSIYGGQNHEVYLGCLNCSSYDQSSIWNEYGTYGSSYNSISIWNSYGTYGSAYNVNSPWNPYGSNPPVVVDQSGNFYGYLTVNEMKSKRFQSELALTLYKYHDLIKDDVGTWYEKILE